VDSTLSVQSLLVPNLKKCHNNSGCKSTVDAMIQNLQDLDGLRRVVWTRGLMVASNQCSGAVRQICVSSCIGHLDELFLGNASCTVLPSGNSL
jgi:hypothetical protein